MSDTPKCDEHGDRLAELEKMTAVQTETLKHISETVERIDVRTTDLATKVTELQVTHAALAEKVAHLKPKAKFSWQTAKPYLIGAAVVGAFIGKDNIEKVIKLIFGGQ